MLKFDDCGLDETPCYNVQNFNWWSLKPSFNYGSYTINNAFCLEEIDNIIKLGISTQIDKSKTGNQSKGEFSDIRKSENSWIHPNSMTQWLFEKLSKYIFSVNENFGFDLHSLEALQFTIYDETYDGNYSSHVDQWPSAPSADSHRKLSFSVQLTPPDLYEGGELKIYHETLTDPNIACKDLGCINFFPSYVLHEVTPVTKGRRYCLVGWANGPKFK